MGAIYAVVGFWTNDPEEYIEKAFGDLESAIWYKAELEADEEVLRSQAKKCRECKSKNESCPLYTMPMYDEDECESELGLRSDKYYRIETIEYEEKYYGKKNKNNT